MNIRNAVIIEASIEVFQGTPAAWVRLDYGSQQQNFGGYPFKNGMGEAFVSGILAVVGAKSWQALVGMAVRAEQDDKGVYRLGHIIEDVWFDPAKAAAALAPKQEEAAPEEPASEAGDAA